MGTLFSTLDIARSGMQVSTIQMSTAGHNIANVSKEGFSRQRVELAARIPLHMPFGKIGRGVEIMGINRVRDIFLDKVYRQTAPRLGEAEVQAQFYSRIEDVFLEPDEGGFGQNFEYFFDSLNDLANNVEQFPVRKSVLVEAQSLASSLNEVAERLAVLRTNANEEVANIVAEVNSLVERVALLNGRIRATELDNVKANDLRDERDVLLDELSKLVEANIVEREDGQVAIFVADDVLLEGRFVETLEAVADPTLDLERNDLLEVRLTSTGSALNIRAGELFGALNIRDNVLTELDGRLDTMTATLIEQVNRIHTTGRGLANLSGTRTSANPVSDAVTALDSANLPFSVTPGTFDLIVYDGAGNPTTTTITVGAGTTLTTLAADLNSVGNFSASVSGGNRLEFGTAGPYTFRFANDTSNALTALGMNALFTGGDARDIGVSQDILDNPQWLTSGFSTDPLDTGDNSAALAMADVRTARVLNGDTETIGDFYEFTIANLGIQARANAQQQEVEQSFTNDFERRRLEVSGVSLDEEVTNMLQYQRAFQASARLVSVVDRMLDSLINLGR